MFKIIKKGSGNFWHNFNNGSKEVNLSDWEIVLDSVNQTVSLQMLNGANVPNNSVIISDVVVIDETDSSVEETFVSVSALRTRLIELNYTPYIVLNGFVPEAPIDGLTYGRKDAEWVEVSGGGGSVGTLQQVTDNGNTTTNDIKVSKLYLKDSASELNGRLYLDSNNWFFEDSDGVVRFIATEGSIFLKNRTSEKEAVINTNLLTANRTYTLPDANGTIALTSDIPTVDATPTDGSSNAVSSNGVFDGLALKQDTLTDVNFGSFSTSLTSKTTPVDADTVNLVDSADSNKSKKLSFTNLKAFLKTYFDTQYQPRQSFKLTDTVPSSDLTGTTTETAVKSYTIAANSFAIGDFFNVKLHISYTTANAGYTRIQYLKVSNTNNYATANTVLQNNNSAAANYALLRNSCYFVSGNILRTVTSETSRTIDNGNFAVQPVDYTLDPTQPIYVWVGMKNGYTTDVGKFLSLSITN